jgi:hypothetical protein
MSNYIGNYSPDDFTIVISKGDFVHTVSGFADGAFVSMNRLVPSSTPYVGVGRSNSMGRVKRAVTAMTVDVTLHQYSPSNTVLQQLQIADADTSDNTWVFSVTIKDLSGQTVASSNSAIIAAPPAVEFSSETSTRAWQIYLFGSDLFVGGNTPLAPAEVAAVEAAGGEVDSRWRLNP